MTFLESLQSHKGGLIRLKTELFWYNRGGWDGVPGRVCLVLDAVAATPAPGEYYADAAAAAACTDAASAVAFLLIDDRPKWIWVTEADVEIL